jgi:hypothetical protein
MFEPKGLKKGKREEREKKGERRRNPSTCFG